MNNFVVQIGELKFTVSLFCFQKVGNTENMKFRVESSNGYIQDFDDAQSMYDFFSTLIYNETSKLMLAGL